MCRFVLLMLLKWIVTVFAIPVNNPAGTKGSIVDKNDFIAFHTHKKYRWRSAEKCKEYAQSVGQTVWILPLTASRPIPISTDCKLLVNPLISGGEIAQPGEFPHMAAIGWLLKDRTIGYHCGGTLISDRWVLTAAHCTHGQLGTPFAVRLGANRLSELKSGQLVRIGDVIRHPDYRPPSMYADLALLGLSTSITFGSDIKPACLHSQFEKAPNQAWVTGWGSTQTGDEPSDVLLKAKLLIVDNVRCSMLHNFTTSVPSGVVPSMLCAGDPNGGWSKDTCQGDSGGPLQAIQPNSCLYELVGITSFGQLCATPDSPSVYTRVSHYVEWIESIVWPDDD